MEKNNNEVVNYEIDKNIIYTMLGVTLVASVVFIIKTLKHSPCDIVNFDINAKEYRVGEIIRFKDYSENANQHNWDFGDESTNRFDVNPFHTYNEAGKYTITLTVNDDCQFSREIVIKEKVPTIDSTRIANFEIPTSIKVGELLNAKDLTKGATSWEWRFGETSEVNSTYQNPTYSYKEAGLKTVTLIVNGDPRYSSQKQINVLPGFESKKPEPKRVSRTPIILDNEIDLPDAPEIADAPPTEEIVVKKSTISRSAFANKLIQVSEGKASAADFQKYLCNENLQTNTSAKGKKTTFIEFCQKIKGKKIKIKSLELFKNKETKCIEYISVDYSKGIF